MIIPASNVKVLDILDLCLEIRGLRGLSFRQYSALIFFVGKRYIQLLLTSKYVLNTERSNITLYQLI